VQQTIGALKSCSFLGFVSLAAAASSDQECFDYVNATSDAFKFHFGAAAEKLIGRRSAAVALRPKPNRSIVLINLLN
jgi:hypothetical protein